MPGLELAWSLFRDGPVGLWSMLLDSWGVSIETA